MEKVFHFILVYFHLCPKKLSPFYLLSIMNLLRLKAAKCLDITPFPLFSGH
jgi:hypothetical protein